MSRCAVKVNVTQKVQLQFLSRISDERIDKANDTIRLLRSQAKGLQEKVKLQAAEIATLKGGGAGAATLTTPSGMFIFLRVVGLVGWRWRRCSR